MEHQCLWLGGMSCVGNQSIQLIKDKFFVILMKLFHCVCNCLDAIELLDDPTFMVLLLLLFARVNLVGCCSIYLFKEKKKLFC